MYNPYSKLAPKGVGWKGEVAWRSEGGQEEAIDRSTLTKDCNGSFLSLTFMQFSVRSA